MDGEDDRKQPQHLVQSEELGDEGFAVVSHASEHTAPAATSAKDVKREETESSDAGLQEPISSARTSDPTPSGPTEPTRNVEIELPAGWNGSGAKPSERSGIALESPSGPTEPSRHVQIELPTGWDRSGAEPSDSSGDVFNPPSAPLPRHRAPVPPYSARGSQGDRERLVPSIIVTVSLGHSRDMFEQAVEAAIQRATQKFHKIAKQEIDLFAFEQRAARRAADYRLRGPNPQ